MTSLFHTGSSRRSSAWVVLLAPCAIMLGVLLCATPAAEAFNSEEHKVLADLGVAQVVPDASIQLPYPTRFESFPVTTLRAAYTAAKNLAVGYATNNALWHSYCTSPRAPDADPTGYDSHRLAVQDNSYWDADHTQFNQIEGNMNMWIPPASLVQENALWVSGALDGTVRTFTFGDLVSIYGDYRRTTHCDGGTCYLSDVSLASIGFARGTDCYGVPPFRTCGYEPAPLRSDVYLKRIAAGLWPPYGCLGNAIENTARNDEYDDAGWWGDEMMRIANVNEWHFSTAAMAWYVGMHRLALLYVNAARTDPNQWNAALHCEANALHSLTDLFCFGHIVTNRDETSRGVMVDEVLTGRPAYLWMEHVLAMGGARRNSSGRVTVAGTLPGLTNRAGARNDFLPSYLGRWANWARWEHTYHSDFNASGAVVRNLRGDRFHVFGDGQVRNYSPADRDVIVNAVRTSLQSLFDAYLQLQAGATTAELASAGSPYFGALRWIPAFVETDPGAHFTGRWLRYAGAVAAISGSTTVPPTWANCQMAYINGGENLPAPSANPCTAFPVLTGVWVEDLAVTPLEAGVSLTWRLTQEAVGDLVSVQVQRAGEAGGPYSTRSASPLAPSRSMSFDDIEAETARLYWYRLELTSRTGMVIFAGPVQAVAGGMNGLRTALAVPLVPAGGPVEFRFSLGPSSGVARLDLYDVGGRIVKSLAEGLTGPGQYLRTWDRRDERGSEAARGVYVVRLRTGNGGASRKLVLVQR